LPSKRAKSKAEGYYQRWRREHPKVTFYLDEATYCDLKRMAEMKGMTVKDFVLSLIEGFDKYYSDIVNESVRSGIKQTLVAFVEHPKIFISFMEDYYPEGCEKLVRGELAFFTVPCSICGKPMLITHKSSNWEREIKPTLLEAFKYWCHTTCGTKR
jgi:hypothetical protein